jgi:hypothetical protein
MGGLEPPIHPARQRGEKIRLRPPTRMQWVAGSSPAMTHCGEVNTLRQMRVIGSAT